MIALGSQGFLMCESSILLALHGRIQIWLAMSMDVAGAFLSFTLCYAQFGIILLLDKVQEWL